MCHEEGGSNVCGNFRCSAVIHADCLREYRESVHKQGRSAVCACLESFDQAATRTAGIITEAIKDTLRCSFLFLVVEWAFWRTPSIWEVMWKLALMHVVLRSRFEKLHRLVFDKQTASWSQIAGFLAGLVLFLSLFLIDISTDKLYPNYLFLRLITIIDMVDTYLVLFYRAPEFLHWLIRVDYIIIDDLF